MSGVVAFDDQEPFWHQAPTNSNSPTNKENKMKQIHLSIMLLLTLTACSQRVDPEAKNQPVMIDKAQIDIASSTDISALAPVPSTNWFCMLLGKTDADEGKLLALVGRTAQVTDGQEVLGSGRIMGALLEAGGKKAGLRIAFESPEAAGKLYTKLGIRR
jgi:hypothetical protein